MNLLSVKEYRKYFHLSLTDVHIGLNLKQSILNCIEDVKLEKMLKHLFIQNYFHKLRSLLFLMYELQGHSINFSSLEDQ